MNKEELKYKLSKSVLKIYDSYKVSKKDFVSVLTHIAYAEDAYDTIFEFRGAKNMRREWAVHNCLYNFGIEKERTKDVDFEFEQKWYWTISYAICFPIAWLLIR